MFGNIFLFGLLVDQAPQRDVEFIRIFRMMMMMMMMYVVISTTLSNNTV